MKDRVAIVAASSQGLGKAVALGLAREGARLVICARNAATLENTAAAIRRETGVDVVARAADVTVETEVQSLVRETVDHFGRVDICVTNAGGPPSKPFAATTTADWRSAVDLNLMSTVYFAREVLPLMQKQKWGRMIAITSVAVKQPIEGLILSNSVRSAVHGLVKTLANEYGRDNVLVNCACPDYTRTERLAALAQAGRGEEQWTAQIPLGRLGEPEEFASAVVFLASERASYMTGSAIVVDGGLVRWI